MPIAQQEAVVQAVRGIILLTIYDDVDNDYEDTQSQANYATCPYCNGGGIVYATDMYGNVLVDYYGNPQTITCGNCGGSGQVIVYQ